MHTYTYILPAPVFSPAWPPKIVFELQGSSGYKHSLAPTHRLFSRVSQELPSRQLISPGLGSSAPMTVIRLHFSRAGDPFLAQLLPRALQNSVPPQLFASTQDQSKGMDGSRRVWMEGEKDLGTSDAHIPKHSLFLGN